MAEHGQFRSIDGIVRVATWTLSGCIVVKACLLFGLLQEFPNFAQKRSLHWDSSLGVIRGSVWLGCGQFLLVLVSGLLVVAALRRGYLNRAAFGLATPYSRARSLICWFIPIANLIAPYQPAISAWKGTTPDGPPRYRSLWWGAYVAYWLERVVEPTHRVASGWYASQPWYREMTAATAILVAILTIAMLRNLTIGQQHQSGRLPALVAA